MMKRVALVVLMLAVLALAAACGSDEPAVEVEPTSGEATGLDGATILAEKCDGVCHSLDKVRAAEYDAVGWAEVITQMNEKGADVSDDEAAALAEYLSLQ
jgi:ABC-type glycerol-3-phosphate transport system substrate-binding protein